MSATLYHFSPVTLIIAPVQLEWYVFRALQRYRCSFKCSESCFPPVDTELKRSIQNLPSYFAIDVDNLEPPPTDPRERIFYWEKITVNLSGQSRLMRLHRPWLSRGYKDRKYVVTSRKTSADAYFLVRRYEYSRDQCIRAARNCLKLMTDDHGTAVFLERWWILLFYGMSIGVHSSVLRSDAMYSIVTVAAVVVLIDLLVSHALCRQARSRG